MPAAEIDVDAIHSDLLDVALGDLPIDRVLDQLVARFGGVGGAAFELNRETGEISNWVGPGLEGGARDYIEHICGPTSARRRVIRTSWKGERRSL